jgi:1,4-dihydroxy-2-naphthoate polyprenyltransferase
MFLKNIKIWIKATRLETLIISICPITISAFLAHKEVEVNFLILFLSYLYGLFIHLGTNLANDYFDFIKGTDTPNRIAPLSTIQTNETSLKQIKIAYILCFSIAFIIGLFFIFRGGILPSLLFALPIFAGLFYTAGSKALGYIGLGEILVFLFFGPYAVLGTYFLQTLKISIIPIIIGCGIGFLATAVLVINNLRDMQTDKEADKNTLVVKFGKKFGQIEYFLCTIFAFLIPFIYFSISKKPLILCSSIFIFFVPFKLVKNYQESFLLNNGLQKTVFLTIIYTIFFCLGLI